MTLGRNGQQAVTARFLRRHADARHTRGERMQWGFATAVLTLSPRRPLQGALDILNSSKCRTRKEDVGGFEVTNQGMFEVGWQLQ